MADIKNIKFSNSFKNRLQNISTSADKLSHFNAAVSAYTRISTSLLKQEKEGFGFWYQLRSFFGSNPILNEYLTADSQIRTLIGYDKYNFTMTSKDRINLILARLSAVLTGANLEKFSEFCLHRDPLSPVLAYFDQHRDLIESDNGHNYLGEYKKIIRESINFQKFIEKESGLENFKPLDFSPVVHSKFYPYLDSGLYSDIIKILFKDVLSTDRSEASYGKKCEILCSAFENISNLNRESVSSSLINDENSLMNDNSKIVFEEISQYLVKYFFEDNYVEKIASFFNYSDSILPKNSELFLNLKDGIRVFLQKELDENLISLKGLDDENLIDKILNKVKFICINSSGIKIDLDFSELLNSNIMERFFLKTPFKSNANGIILLQQLQIYRNIKKDLFDIIKILFSSKKPIFRLIFDNLKTEIDKINNFDNYFDYFNEFCVLFSVINGEFNNEVLKFYYSDLIKEYSLLFSIYIKNIIFSNSFISENDISKIAAIVKNIFNNDLLDDKSKLNFLSEILSSYKDNIELRKSIFFLIINNSKISEEFKNLLFAEILCSLNSDNFSNLLEKFIESYLKYNINKNKKLLTYDTKKSETYCSVPLSVERRKELINNSIINLCKSLFMYSNNSNFHKKAISIYVKNKFEKDSNENNIFSQMYNSILSDNDTENVKFIVNELVHDSSEQGSLQLGIFFKTIAIYPFLLQLDNLDKIIIELHRFENRKTSSFQPFFNAILSLLFSNIYLQDYEKFFSFFAYYESFIASETSEINSSSTKNKDLFKNILMKITTHVILDFAKIESNENAQKNLLGIFNLFEKYAPEKAQQMAFCEELEKFLSFEKVDTKYSEAYAHLLSEIKKKINHNFIELSKKETIKSDDVEASLEIRENSSDAQDSSAQQNSTIQDEPNKTQKPFEQIKKSLEEIQNAFKKKTDKDQVKKGLRKFLKFMCKEP